MEQTREKEENKKRERDRKLKRSILGNLYGSNESRFYWNVREGTLILQKRIYVKAEIDFNCNVHNEEKQLSRYPQFVFNLSLIYNHTEI